MAPKQQVLVADIVKTLQATNQRLITKEKALQLFDDVFRQPKEADQVLDREMTHAYVPSTAPRIGCQVLPPIVGIPIMCL
jgi:hypothetical protein